MLICVFFCLFCKHYTVLLCVQQWITLSCSPTQVKQHHHYLSCERMGGESGDDQGSMLTPFNISIIFPIYHNRLFNILLMFTYLFTLFIFLIVQTWLLKTQMNIGWVNQAVVVQAQAKPVPSTNHLEE